TPASPTRKAGRQPRSWAQIKSVTAVKWRKELTPQCYSSLRRRLIRDTTGSDPGCSLIDLALVAVHDLVPLLARPGFDVHELFVTLEVGCEPSGRPSIACSALPQRPWCNCGVSIPRPVGMCDGLSPDGAYLAAGCDG